MKLSTAQVNAMTELMKQTLGFHLHPKYKAIHKVRTEYAGINKSTLKVLQNKGLIIVCDELNRSGSVAEDCIHFTSAGWQWLEDNGILNDNVIAEGYNTPSEAPLTIAQEKAMQRLVENYYDMVHSEYAKYGNNYVDVRYMTYVMKIANSTLDALILKGYLEHRLYKSYITDKQQITLLFTRKGWQWLFDNDMLNYYEKGVK